MRVYDRMSAYDDCTHITNPTAKTPKVRFITDKVKSLANPTYTVDIDFDEAADAWMANKVRRGPSVCYQCTAIKKDGHPCAKAILVQYAEDPFLCKTHKPKGSPVLDINALL